MIDKHEVAKLGLAFAVGVSLSAGYVVLGLQVRAPDVVVVQEQCPEPDEERLRGRERELPAGLELAPLPGEEQVPEGLALWLSLDGLWSGEVEGEALVKLERGRIAAGDLDRHRVRALEPIAREQARSSSTAVLWIDHRIPGATLIDLLYTLERAGFHEFALVVEGRGSPEVLRFESKIYGSFIDTHDSQWTAALSLRLEPLGVSAWLAPRSEGKPQLGAPAPLPLALDEADSCMLGAPLPEPARVAALERELCELEGVPLAVEYMITAERSVGELLALRAMDARSDACRGPSNIVAPEASAPTCAGALAIPEALARLAAAAPAEAGESPKASVVGALAKQEVRKVVAARIGEVRHCYNEGLMTDPGLAGSVIVDFTIDERGTVVESGLDDRTDLPDRKTARCIVKAVSRWKFPKPEQGEVVVSYPFVLSPG